MGDFLARTDKRVRMIFFALIVGLAALLLRIGYMQIFYQNNVVTFAQINQKVVEQNSQLIDEVKARFNVDLTLYKEITKEELIYRGKTDLETMSLVDIIHTSCASGCIGKPAILINEMDGIGFVFLKNASGENVLMEMKQANEKWGLVSTKIAGE